MIVFLTNQNLVLNDGVHVGVCSGVHAGVCSGVYVGLKTQ